MAEVAKAHRSTEPTVYLCMWDTPETVLPGSGYGPVVRNVYTIECNVSGYGTVTVNDKTFRISPGDFYCLLPGQTVSFTADRRDPRMALYCTAGGLRLGQMLHEAGITDAAPFAPPEKFDALFAVMQKMYALGKENGLGASLQRTACLYELMGILTKGRVNTNTDHFADHAIGLMETTYHTGVSVSDIATEMGFDRCYFSTLFKRHTGVSPHAYLTSLRIEKAKALLGSSDRTVSEVAESVGLDPRNFARLFKKETGKTPNFYKRIS